MLRVEYGDSKQDVRSTLRVRHRYRFYSHLGADMASGLNKEWQVG